MTTSSDPNALIVCCDNVERPPQPSLDKMTLLQLPSEIICQIVNMLAPLQRNILGQTCHHFRSLPSPSCRLNVNRWSHDEKMLFIHSLLRQHSTASKRICVRCIKILPGVDFAARSPIQRWDLCLRHGYIWRSPSEVLDEYLISRISSVHTALRLYTPKDFFLDIDNQIKCKDYAEGRVAYLETSIELCPVVVTKFRSALKRRSILSAELSSKSTRIFVASLLRYAHIPVCRHLKISNQQVLAAYDVEVLVEDELRSAKKSLRCCFDCRRVGATTQFRFQVVHCADETADRERFALRLILVRGLKVVSGKGSTEAVHRSRDWEGHMISDHSRPHLRQAWEQWEGSLRRTMRNREKRDTVCGLIAVVFWRVLFVLTDFARGLTRFWA